MAKRGGYPKMGGNMGNMMKQMQKMQKQMQKMQEEAEKKEFDVSVGGGAVVVKINGKKEVTDIILKEEIVDPDDIEMLQDLLISAVNEAIRKAEEAMNDSMGKLTQGLNIPGL